MDRQPVYSSHVIVINGTQIPYTIKANSRSLHLRMAITPETGLCVSAPPLFPHTLVEKFLLQKSSWITRNIARMKELEGKIILNGGQHEYREYKELAFQRICAGVHFFNKLYNFPYRRISIRNQKTVWGSCTKTGNLQFNYKLIHLPKHLMDYVIVHELCHLKEHNHSRAFWDLVAKTMPEYKSYRKALHSYIIR